MIWGGTPIFGVNFVVFDRMEKIVQHLLFFSIVEYQLSLESSLSINAW